MRIIQAFVIIFQKWNRYSSRFSLWILFLFSVGCGVKGDPLPPEKPPLLGRGKPAYKQATEEISLPQPPQIIFDEDEDRESDYYDEE